MKTVSKKDFGKLSFMDNSTLGFYTGGGNRDMNEHRSLQIDHIASLVNIIQVRQSSNIFESNDSYKQMNQLMMELAISNKQTISYILEFCATWPKNRAEKSKYSIELVGSKVFKQRDDVSSFIFSPNMDHKFNINGTKLKLQNTREEIRIPRST